LTQEEIKKRLIFGDACYHSFSNLLSSTLLSINLKIKTFKIVILPSVLCWCETYSLTLRKKHKLRVFDKSMLRTLHIMIKSRWKRWQDHVARMRNRNSYRLLVGKPERRIPLGIRKM
jgi:hypothetical protein